MTLILDTEEIHELLVEAAVQWGPLAEARAVSHQVVVDELLVEVAEVQIRPRPNAAWHPVAATLDELGARREVNEFERAQEERLARCDDVTEPWPAWRT